MADTQNSALAGAENAPAQPEGMSVLDMHWEGDPQAPADDLEGSEAVENPEPAESEDDAELAGSEEAEISEAGEEGEGPADDAAEPETPPADDDETIHGNKFVVLRDNTKVRVGDLKQSYERLQEIERHLPQIQQERAQFQQERQAFAAQTQQLQPILAQVATVLQSRIPPEPSMELLQNDPIEFHNLRFQREQALRELAQVNQAHQQQMQAAQAQQQQRHRAFLAAEQQRLVEALPELRDAEKAKAFASDFHKVGAAVGFSQQEMGQVFDHRLFKLAKLAARGLAAQEAEAKAAQVKTQQARVAAQKVADKPPVTPPAARQSAAIRKDQESRGALEKLRKTGSKAAADDFFARFE